MCGVCILSIAGAAFFQIIWCHLSLFFIDDLCVDQEARGQHIGESLFEYVKSEAKQLGCYEVTLNVWAGNTPAEKFYEKWECGQKKGRWNTYYKMLNCSGKNSR